MSPALWWIEGFFVEQSAYSSSCINLYEEAKQASEDQPHGFSRLTALIFPAHICDLVTRTLPLSACLN